MPPDAIEQPEGEALDTGHEADVEPLGHGLFDDTEAPVHGIDDDDDLLDNDAPVAEAEAESESDDYIPPTKEEYEELQSRANLTDLNLEDLIAKGEEELESTQPDPNAAGLEDFQSMMTPKEYQFEYQPSEELVNAALVEGSPKAIGKMLNEATNGAALQMMEVMQHNQRIEMHQSITNAVQYMSPVLNTVSRFIEANPKLAGARELVQNKLWDIRQRFPQANEMQLLAAAKKELDPLVKRVEKIAGQSAAGGKQLNVGGGAPSASATTSSPRPSSRGGSQSGEPSTAEMLAAMRNHSATTL
jgi:hypothetical protein